MLTVGHRRLLSLSALLSFIPRSCSVPIVAILSFALVLGSNKRISIGQQLSPSI